MKDLGGVRVKVKSIGNEGMQKQPVQTINKALAVKASNKEGCGQREMQMGGRLCVSFVTLLLCF